LALVEDAIPSLGHILKCFQTPSIKIIGATINNLNPYSILAGIHYSSLLKVKDWFPSNLSGQKD
jgi:hypothetical protein